jgi:carbonic anhydrase
VQLKKTGSWPFILAAIWLPAAAYAQWKTPWSYEGATGPDHWTELDPDYAACNVGKEQSPIDIQNIQAADLPKLRFYFKGSPLRYLVNNSISTGLAKSTFTAGSSTWPCT